MRLAKLTSPIHPHHHYTYGYGQIPLGCVFVLPRSRTLSGSRTGQLCYPVPEWATRFWNRLPSLRTGQPRSVPIENFVRFRNRTAVLSCPIRELATHVSSQWSLVLSSEVSVAIEYLTMLEGIHDSETVLTCKWILYSREYTLIKYCINQWI